MINVKYKCSRCAKTCTDKELLQGLLAVDKWKKDNSYRCLYGRGWWPVRNILTNMGANAELIKDIFQDSIVALKSAIEKGAKIGFVIQFLIGISKNKYLDHLKREKRIPMADLEDYDSKGDQKFGVDIFGEAEVAEDEEAMKRKLDAFLDSLTEKERMIFIDKYFHGLNDKAIAQIYDFKFCTERYGILLPGSIDSIETTLYKKDKPKPKIPNTRKCGPPMMLRDSIEFPEDGSIWDAYLNGTRIDLNDFWDPSQKESGTYTLELINRDEHECIVSHTFEILPPLDDEDNPIDYRVENRTLYASITITPELRPEIQRVEWELIEPSKADTLLFEGMEFVYSFPDTDTGYYELKTTLFSSYCPLKPLYESNLRTISVDEGPLRLGGRITNNRGLPIRDAQVILYQQNASEVWFERTRKSINQLMGGYYTFDRLPAAQYRVYVIPSSPNVPTYYNSNGYTSHSEEAETISLKFNRDDIDIKVLQTQLLSRNNGCIARHVEEVIPIDYEWSEGTMAILKNPNHHIIAVQPVDKGGHFVFYNLNIWAEYEIYIEQFNQPKRSRNFVAGFTSHDCHLLSDGPPLIAPNPVQDILNIEMKLLERINVEIQVFDMTSTSPIINRRHRELIGNNSLELDFSHLSQGIYFVKVFYDGQLIHTKMISKQ